MAGAYPIFERYGVELEYMIVDRATLDVRPICDEVLRAAAGEITSEYDAGELTWCNELALHVIELNLAQPAPRLEGLADLFQAHVNRIQALLDPLGARLLPTAMHPWMDPHREMRLWPHGYSDFYNAYDRIFDCKGHGFANLQSVHLNLSFQGDAEFARLHAAIRLVLPLIPALAASSPVIDGAATGTLDNRLAVYRNNQRRVPSVAGRVIPEPVFSEADYGAQIFEPMYRDIAPLDPEGLLQDEFLNSRGAIARFGRGSIEVRLIDLQECPRADLAVLAFLAALIRAQAAERWQTLDVQQAWGVAPLLEIYEDCVREGERAIIRDDAFLGAWGMDGDGTLRAGEVLRTLYTLLKGQIAEEHYAALELIFEQGPLARRILTALQGDCSRPALARTYGRLADGLAAGALFRV